MFTFAWAIIGLLIMDKIGDSTLKRWVKNLIKALVFIVFMIVSIILGLDYNMAATAIIFVFYMLRKKADLIRNLVAAGVHTVFRNVGIYWFGLLGFIPLLLYNHKRGRGLKWLFYAFYPGHLLLIWIVLYIMR